MNMDPMNTDSALADGPPRKGEDGSREKRYVELFRQVTIDRGAALTPSHVDIEVCDEKDTPDEAEVCLPFHTADTVYGIVCYLTGVPPDRPAIGEMLLLRGFAGAMAAMTEEIVMTEESR